MSSRASPLARPGTLRFSMQPLPWVRALRCAPAGMTDVDALPVMISASAPVAMTIGANARNGKAGEITLRLPGLRGDRSALGRKVLGLRGMEFTRRGNGRWSAARLRRHAAIERPRHQARNADRIGGGSAAFFERHRRT